MSVDDLSVDDTSVEYLSADNISVDDLSVDDIYVDDLSVDDTYVDNLSVDDTSVENTTVYDLSVDDLSVRRVSYCNTGGGGVLDSRDVLDLMHGRSRMTIDPRIPTMPGRTGRGKATRYQREREREAGAHEQDHKQEDEEKKVLSRDEKSHETKTLLRFACTWGGFVGSYSSAIIRNIHRTDDDDNADYGHDAKG